MRNYFVGARVRPKINTKGKSVDENEKKVEDMKDYFKIDDSIIFTSTSKQTGCTIVGGTSIVFNRGKPERLSSRCYL